MTKDDLDRLHAQACEAEQVWLEDDEEMRMPPPTVLALIARVRELEDKHWIEETETLRLDSPAGREYSRMKEEWQSAKGELSAMNKYLTSRDPLSLTSNESMALWRSKAARYREERDHYRERALAAEAKLE